MRLKDLLSRAASFTRTNIFGEAANDDGVSVTREILSYVPCKTSSDAKYARMTCLSHVN